MLNAYAIHVDATMTANASDSLKADHTDTNQTAVRCWMIQAGSQRAAVTVGFMTHDEWHVRLASSVAWSEDLRVGEKLKLMRDDWSAYRTFEITDTRRHGYHWQLIVKGVGS